MEFLGSGWRGAVGAGLAVLFLITVVCGETGEWRMVFGPECIVRIWADAGTRIVVPLKNGRPDYARNEIIGLRVEVKPGCGRYERER